MTEHEQELADMMVQARGLLLALQRERKDTALWTMICLLLIGVNLYYLEHWSHVRPLWWASLCGAMSLTSALYLSRAVYRHWRHWLVSYRAVQLMVKQVHHLQRFYGYRND